MTNSISGLTRHPSLFSYYPFISCLNSKPILGLLPCMIIQERKILPPIQTDSRVKISTPRSPAIGCQMGMVTCVACRTSISIGVNGGINDIVVAKLPNGFCITGIITNMGMISGSIAGNWMACASFESLQVDPIAANMHPVMMIFNNI